MKVNIKKTVLIALYTSLFVVLSLYGTINLYGLKITIQNIAIYMVAFTMGMLPGTIVGFAGMFINQMLTYGFQATTLFWVLPQTILGAVTGYIFENNFVNVSNGKKFWITIISLQILLTILNTISLLIDSLIYGYYNFFTVFGTLVIRLMISILTGIVFSIVIPILEKITKKIH